MPIKKKINKGLQDAIARWFLTPLCDNGILNIVEECLSSLANEFCHTRAFD